MSEFLKISPALLYEMTRYVAEHAPLEACGLLAGRAHRAEVLLGVTNQAQSAVRFVMDPYEQLRAFDWIDAQGLDLVAIFHSHPAGPATASPTDIAEAPLPCSSHHPLTCSNKLAGLRLLDRCRAGSGGCVASR